MLASRSVVCFLVASIAVLTSAARADGGSAPCQYEVTVIQAPDCGVFGSRPTLGSAINELGHVVGNYCDCPCEGHHAYFWSPETGFVTLEPPTGVSSADALDINESGQIVGTMETPAMRGFLYEDGAWTELPPQAGGAWRYALSVNNSGNIVGYRSLADTDLPMTAYVWTPLEGFVDLGDMQHPFGTTAFDINDAGEIAGSRGTPLYDDEAFLWNSDRLMFLGVVPGGFTSISASINVHGQIVANGLVDDPESGMTVGRSFIWGRGVTTVLSTLPGYPTTAAHAINDPGQVVGDVASLSGARRATLWEGGITYDLNELVASGSGVVQRAWDINNAGQIIANGLDPSGAVVAFRLTPLPPPPGDLNVDCEVGFADLLVLLSAWGPCAGCPQDLDGDGAVGFTDLLTLLMNWT